MWFTIGLDHGATITGADISLFSKIKENTHYGVFFVRLEPQAKIIGSQIVESCDGWRTFHLDFERLTKGLEANSTINKEILLLVTNETDDYMSCSDIKKMFYIDYTTDITDFPVPVAETEPKKPNQEGPDKESEESEESGAIISKLKTTSSPSSRPEDTSTAVVPSSKPEDTSTAVVPISKPEDISTADVPSSKPEDISTTIVPSSMPEETGLTTGSTETQQRILSTEERFFPRMTLFLVGGPLPDLG